MAWLCVGGDARLVAADLATLALDALLGLVPGISHDHHAGRPGRGRLR
ncbi:hypothetical protein [Frankia tisae]|nr:hypothetical protein [Frankia tisae]